MFFKIAVVTLICGVVQSSKLPSYIKPCSPKDPNFDDCCKKHAIEALPSIINGDRKYGIPSFKPLLLDSVTLDNNDRLKLALKKLKIYGIEDIIIEKTHFDVNKRKVFIMATIPRVVIDSNYEMKGKVLVLPINGEGRANITVDGAKIEYNMDYKVVDNHLVIDKDNIDLAVKRVYVNFDSLFNGNEELSKNTNKVLNDEWEKVYQEVKGALISTISTIYRAIFGNFAKHVDFNEIFI